MKHFALRWSGLGLAILAAAIVADSATTARADELPVIAVNREIGLALSGLWSNSQYRDPTGSADGEQGWTPGFSAKASVMSDALGVSNLFARLTYQFNSGSLLHSAQSINGLTHIDYDTGLTANDVIGELGKGFLVTPNLLLTPVVELEYRDLLRTETRSKLSSQTDYTSFAPGAALRATYAVMPRLVLSSKLGLEYTISPSATTVGNGAHGVPDLSFDLGTRPVWQAGLGADYAVTRSIHAYVDADYAHFGFGASNVDRYGAASGEYLLGNSNDQVSLNIGLAWSF